MNDQSKKSGEAGSSLVQEESIRQDLVDTAVRFLQNPKVQQTPVEQKNAFLVKKGLNSLEISAALQKSSSSPVNPSESFGTNPVVPYFAQQGSGPYPQYYQPQTHWRDYASVAIIVSGAGYGLYKIFRRLILPHFFGVPDPEERQLRHLEERVEELQNSMKFVMDSVQQTLESVQQQQSSLQKALNILTDNNNERGVLSQAQVQELKTEVGVVKSLLLSRNQFPPLPSEAGTPGVPAWQLQGIRSVNPQNNGASYSLAANQRPKTMSGTSSSTQNGYATAKSDRNDAATNGYADDSSDASLTGDDVIVGQNVTDRSNRRKKQKKEDLEPEEEAELSTPV